VATVKTFQERRLSRRVRNFSSAGGNKRSPDRKEEIKRRGAARVAVTNKRRLSAWTMLSSEGDKTI